MSALTFSVKRECAQRIDLSALTADRLAGLTLAQIERIELHCGRHALPLAELFFVSGNDADDLVIEGAYERLDWIGRAMTRGRIHVAGDAGAYAGAMMRSGELSIAGSAGVFAACEMRDGTLTVHGNAGDFLGGARPGEMRGMRGGAVRVAGSVGERAGDRMRRGTILVGGDAGAFCASRMIAGTIAVLGSIGNSAGYAMTRGTLLCAQAPAPMLPTFNECGTYELSFLSLMLRQWRDMPVPFSMLASKGARVQRWTGDLGAGGKGEILVWR